MKKYFFSFILSCSFLFANFTNEMLVSEQARIEAEILAKKKLAENNKQATKAQPTINMQEISAKIQEQIEKANEQYMDNLDPNSGSKKIKNRREKK